MRYKVGIPRALLYYQFSTLWHTFFDCLDVEVVVSGKTNKHILDLGSARVVDEACLPVKIFFGHAAQLAQQRLDFLFVPRIVSIEKKAYICPKIMGLPDMLEAAKIDLPPLIKPTINMVSSRDSDSFLLEISRSMNIKFRKIKNAWEIAQSKQEKENIEALNEIWIKDSSAKKDINTATKFYDTEQMTIMLLGHHYLIHDNFLNLNLVEKLEREGCNIIIPEQIPAKLQAEEVEVLPKKFFWTYGKVLMGSARCFAKLPGIKGFIILTSFGCGIDSFVDNMVIRYIKREGIPYLNIILDEHTGEAGVDTRVEAFLDMIRWRRQGDEIYIPAYGTYMDNNKDPVRASGAGRYCTAPHQ